MIRQKLTVGLIASGFALSLAPVWAEPARGAQSGSRPSNGETVVSAVPRDSGGSSGTSSGGSSGSSSGGSSGGGTTAGSSWGNSQPSEARPRPQRTEEQRRGGGTSSGRAVPRGSSGSGGSTSSTAGSNGGRDRSDGRTGENVPTYSRPRDGRQPVGSAVERRGARPGAGGGGVAYYPGVFYDPYYSYYSDPFYYRHGGRYSSYWSPHGYGYGLGYLAYDPFLSGAYGGYGTGYGAYGYDPYQGGYGAGSSYRGVGSIRLKVKPSEAQVYVDGYYVGVIDSYDGAFQRLNIEEGPHKVEVRAEGYEPVQFDVMVTPGETITYKGELIRRP